REAAIGTARSAARSAGTTEKIFAREFMPSSLMGGRKRPAFQIPSKPEEKAAGYGLKPTAQAATGSKGLREVEDPRVGPGAPAGAAPGQIQAQAEDPEQGIADA